MHFTLSMVVNDLIHWGGFTVTHFYCDGSIRLEREYFDDPVVIFVKSDGTFKPSFRWNARIREIASKF